MKNKDKIENELGEKLKWMELPGKKASRIKISKEGDVNNTDNWDNYFDWLIVEAEKFQKVFPKYIKRVQG